MGTGRSRERLLIGEVAELLGITPKAIRHYEQLWLLKKPERTESGCRLYATDDLLRSVLEALLGEVEGQIEHLQRRARLKQMIAEEDPSEAGEEPYMLALAQRHLGEMLSTSDPQVLALENRFLVTLGAFQ
jgi:DNA-binding transcriptional MerR regulator